MKYGVCLSADQADRIRFAAECGFDYVELNFTELARMGDGDFENLRGVLDECGVSCEAANCFVPGDIRLTGADVDPEAACAHVEIGMKRAAELGIRVVVFGSGGVRSLDESTSFRDGFLQLAGFLGKIAGPIAAKYGICVAVEPLRKQESNIINRVKEGVMLAAASGCENVGGLGDLYHMATVGDSMDELRDLKGCIIHSHIANPALNTANPRRYPADPAEYPYGDFISAIQSTGCLRCSIEANCDDFEKDAPAALKFLRSL